MTTLENKVLNPAAGLAKLWQRTPVLVKAILMIALVGIVGANGISVIFITLPIPLSLIAVLAYLFLYWKFFAAVEGQRKPLKPGKNIFEPAVYRQRYGDGACCWPRFLCWFFNPAWWLLLG